MNAEKRLAIYERLAAANPNPTTELEFSTPFELLGMIGGVIGASVGRSVGKTIGAVVLVIGVVPPPAPPDPLTVG